MLTDDDMQIGSFWAEEERFWLEGADFYRANMAADAVMALPEPTGTLKGPQVLAALENSPRWERVVMFDRNREKLGKKVRLTYRAEGWQNGRAVYEARCVSTYVKMGGEWFLTAHWQERLTR